MKLFDLSRLGVLPVNLSRRGFLGAAGASALVLAVGLPAKAVRAQAQETAGAFVPAFLALNKDGTALLRSPYVEGGQGIYTALAQIVGEELDLEPARFVVETAPPGNDYLLIGGYRFTGGSFSVRSSYDTMRRLGASARAMLIAAAADHLGVETSALSTEPGFVVDTASGQRLPYGDLAEAAMEQTVPAGVPLRDPASFRWIRQPVARLDMRAKSTGQARYSIDVVVEDMLLAAVQHAPRLGLRPKEITNRAEIEKLPGVHSIHLLDGAVAVVADRFWRARAAAEQAAVTWEPGESKWPMSEDFSSDGFRATLAAAKGPGIEVEAEGDAEAALVNAEKVIEATYDAPFLAHAQLEPASATARFNPDGTLDLWIPNQAPEQFQTAAAAQTGRQPDQIRIHSQMLGGFFGRHFLYPTANPYPQAIELAKATGRPIKLIWTREEEMLRDATRPLGLARFRGAVGPDGKPVALAIEVPGEGPGGRWFGQPAGEDGTAHEGLSGKPYAIANRRVGHIPVPNPAVIGFWRSVGHSMHDFFYEGFLDELAEEGDQDPFALRRELVAGSPRHVTLLDAVAELSGGWKRGPFEAEDGTKRARGVALASPFGSEVATISEISLADGEVRVHDVWVAIDPGSMVNPAIIEAQVTSAVALGLSQTLVEQYVYEGGEPQARNFDGYPILTPDRMPRVHVRVIESGAPMGGIGEPGLPGVGPSVVNALAALTGQRVRGLPLANLRLG